MVSDGVGWCDLAPASAPGIPRVLASLARAPFVEDERGRTWCTPLSYGRKGREASVSGVCAGMGGVQRGRTVWVGATRAPRLRPGIPRVLAPLARAPFAGSERGRVDSRLRGNDRGLRRGDSRIAPTFVWFGYSPPVTAVIWNSV